MNTDVVVVGAGVAGLSTALGLAGARRVVVVEDGDGSTPWAQGGIAVAFGDDSPVDHGADTLAAAAGAADPAMVRLLVEEGPQRVAELLQVGARFDRVDGELGRGLEGGHHRRRIVHAGGDATGVEVARALRAACRAAGVEILRARVTGLLQAADGQVVGVETAQPLPTRGASADSSRTTPTRHQRRRLVTDDADSSRRTVAARAVVLATGGVGNAYLASTNPAAVRGDGLALALRAGASLVDMEFVQFHPTALHTGATTGQLPLVTEALRGAGAVLRDADGVAFMADRHPQRDLAPRDVVAREIDAVMTRDAVDNVWLDATSVATLHRFPTVVAACRAIGVDPRRDLIPVAPAEHFLCGGIRVDAVGRTDVPGLYAVGEAAATGVHGANRLASNSLLEGLVFGRRLAAGLVLQLPAAAEADHVASLGIDTDADAVRTTLSRYAGIRRDGDGLAIAAAEIDGNGPLATVARAIVAAATERTESRGCHWRADHPYTVEGHRPVVVHIAESGEPAVLHELRSVS